MEPNKDTEAAGCLPSFPSQRSLKVAPPHHDTIPDRFRSLKDSTFLPLLWWVRAVAWRGQYSCKCQLSMAPLFITLAVSTTENATRVLAKLSPAKTEVTLMIREQELALFLPWDTIHPLIFAALGSCWLWLHAQMTAGKGCPLQFYETTSFPWDRDENLIDHPEKLLQLTFSHSECSNTWTWPEPQESIHHTSTSHDIPFVLASSPNAQQSFPKCCPLVPPTERAMPAGVVQLARLGVKTTRTKNACIFWCCGMHLQEKLDRAGYMVLRGKCGVILHIGCPAHNESPSTCQTK